jgi:hypothetical protein
MRQARFLHQFVEYIPEQIAEGVLYVSMNYAVASHKCACGCGREVVTPISPTDWLLRFDGEAITLEPSIGNWNFPCRSHYFIHGGIVHWASDMSQERIEMGRERDRRTKARYYSGKGSRPPEQLPHQPLTPPLSVESGAVSKSWWKRLINFFK